jgi:hypothetical protein
MKEPTIKDERIVKECEFKLLLITRGLLLAYALISSRYLRS